MNASTKTKIIYHSPTEVVTELGYPLHTRAVDLGGFPATQLYITAPNPHELDEVRDIVRCEVGVYLGAPVFNADVRELQVGLEC